MNKHLKLISLIIIAACIFAFYPLQGFANVKTQADLALDEVKYKSGSEGVYIVREGDISSDVFLTNSSLHIKNAVIITAVYNDLQLLDISITRGEILPQSERWKISCNSVTVESEKNKVKTMAFDTELNSIGKSATLSDKSCGKEITSLKMKIGDYTFEGDVNKDKNEVTVYVPTRYIYGRNFLDIEDKHEKLAPCVKKQTYEDVVKGGIVPQIDGIGQIYGLSEKKDFSAPVLYKIKAEDGSECTYKVFLLESAIRKYQSYESYDIKLDETGFPDSANLVGAQGMGYVNYLAEHVGAETSLTDGFFRFKKTVKESDDDIYSCSQFRFDYLGYAKNVAVEINLRISDLSDGDGFLISLFSTERDEKKNANMILKKTSGNSCDMYWSRGGAENPEPIKNAPLFTQGEFHKLKFIRTMNPQKQKNRKFKGTVDFYFDGEFVASFLDTNYTTPNGETEYSPSVYQNGSYNHIALGSVSKTTQGGVTYTLDIKDINVQAYMYESGLSSPAIEMSLDEDVRSLLNKIDSHFGVQNALWVASKYDSEAGGFYHSESAKQYPLFQSDIQSTSQAIGYMQDSGLWNTEVEEAGMVPEDFRYKLANYAIVRQSDDDGYFYDPQFGKDVTDSKKGRNLYQAQHLISLVEGAEPLYKLPSERIESASLQGTGESASLLSADERFVSEASCLAWLEKTFSGGDYYTAGNEVAAAWTTIEAAGYAKIAYDFVISKQNTRTGLWGTGVDMTAVNAAMKCSVVCRYGPYPNFEKAIESIIQVVSEKEAVTAAELWNPLTLIDGINASIDGGLDFKQWAMVDDALDRMFYQIEKGLGTFRQSDNGYSWYQSGSSPQSQGAFVSMGLPEGDINGNELARRVRDYAYSVAGVAIPELYTKEEKKAFWDAIKNAKPAEKIPLESLPTTMSEDFERCTDGNLPNGWREVRRKNDSVSVCEFDGSNVLKIKGGGYGNSMIDASVRVPANYETAVAKFKIYIENDRVQMFNTMGSTIANGGAFCWCLYDVGGGKVSLSIRRSGSGLGTEIMTLNTGQWYSLEMKYNPSESEKMIVVAVEGQEIYAGAEYYNNGDAEKEPETYVDGIGFRTFKDGTGTVYIDDVMIYYE